MAVQSPVLALASSQTSPTRIQHFGGGIRSACTRILGLQGICSGPPRTEKAKLLVLQISRSKSAYPCRYCNTQKDGSFRNDHFSIENLVSGVGKEMLKRDPKERQKEREAHR